MVAKISAETILLSLVARLARGYAAAAPTKHTKMVVHVVTIMLFSTDWKI